MLTNPATWERGIRETISGQTITREAAMRKATSCMVVPASISQAAALGYGFDEGQIASIYSRDAYRIGDQIVQGENRYVILGGGHPVGWGPVSEYRRFVARSVV